MSNFDQTDRLTRRISLPLWVEFRFHGIYHYILFPKGLQGKFQPDAVRRRVFSCADWVYHHPRIGRTAGRFPSDSGKARFHCVNSGLLPPLRSKLPCAAILALAATAGSAPPGRQPPPCPAPGRSPPPGRRACPPSRPGRRGQKRHTDKVGQFFQPMYPTNL